MWEKYPEICDELFLIEQYIKSNVRSKNNLLSEITTELVDAGGKRVRPALVALTSRFGCCDRERVIKAAGAFEVLHTATLVHDDAVDRADTRRGKPTVSGKYGVDMALYTGDYLFARAVLMLSSSGIAIERLDLVAKAIKTICEGEVDQYRCKYKIDTSIPEYLKRISRKTAVLFAAACSLGAYLGECSSEVSKNLTRFGFYYGMAFQIRDDINNFALDRSKTGKPAGNDLVEGVVTLPVIYALRRNVPLRKLVGEMFRCKGKVPMEVLNSAKDMVNRSGGLEEAADMLKRYIDRGREALKALPDNNSRHVLEELLASV